MTLPPNWDGYPNHRHDAGVDDANQEPYPDRLLAGAASPEPGPDERVEERESIGLAFVAAMQLLPAKQRVAVVLRDVLGWSAREVADLLDDTVPAVNDGRLDRIRLVPARANGRPALAAYADERNDGSLDAYGVMVFAIDGERIAGITGFSRRPALFPRLGLPTELVAAVEQDGGTAKA